MIGEISNIHIERVEDVTLVTCSVDAMAAILGCSYARIHQLQRQGILPRPTDRGRHPLAAIVSAYLDYVKRYEVDDSE